MHDELVKWLRNAAEESCVKCWLDWLKEAITDG